MVKPWLNNGLKIYNYTSSFWIDNFDIFNLFADKYGLRTIKKSGNKNLPKRFNASNLILRNELGNDFEESNYFHVEDVSFLKIHACIIAHNNWV